MTSPDDEWFETWFGEDYVALYPHRNEAEAERVVGLIATTLAGRNIKRALDLACGSGRHSRFLGARWWTSSVDLSEVLLRMAQRDHTPASLVRADIRALPYRTDAFDLVVNLFTSFGYFETDDEHQLVILDIARVILSGGTFVLDYLNASEVQEQLVPFDQKIVKGRSVEQRREITTDGRFVLKRIAIPAERREFVERVRLFHRSELVAMLERAGFSIEASLGDYAGGPLTDSSPRVILFARRN